MGSWTLVRPQVVVNVHPIVFSSTSSGTDSADDHSGHRTVSLNSFSLPIRAGLVVLPGLFHCNTHFVLAIESDLWYNTLDKRTITTATSEKPGSTTCRADITIPASAVSSMLTPLLTLVQAPLFRATTCLPTA